jgi:hypothetical protein
MPRSILRTRRPPPPATQRGEVLRRCEFLIKEKPLLPGEDVRAYDELLASLAQTLQPGDPIECIWVKDIADLVWEAQRLRRWKARLLLIARETALRRILKQVLAAGEDTYSMPKEVLAKACRLASDWTCGRVAALHEVEQLLTEAGLDLESIYAQALSDELGTIERFDRLSTIADLRRDAVLREIDRYRAGLARRLHCSVSAELEKANGILPPKPAMATAACL